jgi:MFS family permease
MSAQTNKNPWLLCAFHALQMSLLPMAILAPFYKREIGMTQQDIYVLQAIFGLFVALFEFPSGYLADRLGYRRTLVLATLGNVVGWALYAAADSFAGVVVAEAVLGVSLSFVSGADSALLYESLLSSKKQAQFTLWTGRMKFWGQTAEGTAALIAGGLFALSPRSPFVAESALWIIAFFVALRLVEPAVHVRAEPRLGHVQEMRKMVRVAFVENRRLRAVIFLTIVMGMSTFVPVWMISVFAAENGLPDTLLGLLWALANYAVALGALSSDRLRRRFGFTIAMVGCIVLVAAGYGSLAVVQGSWVGFLYLLMTFARGVFTPMLAHLEQEELPSGDRAGFLSLRSLVFRGSFLCLGPIVGWAFEEFGFRPVLPVLGASFAVLGVIGLRGVLREDRARAAQLGE